MPAREGDFPGLIGLTRPRDVDLHRPSEKPHAQDQRNARLCWILFGGDIDLQKEGKK
jgi:hypothetical protein